MMTIFLCSQKVCKSAHIGKIGENGWTDYKENNLHTQIWPLLVTPNQKCVQGIFSNHITHFNLRWM